MADDTLRDEGDLSRPFGGEMRLFRLPLGQLRALEKHCGRLGEVAARLVSGVWGVEDVRQVILLALIGGGVPNERASALVMGYVDTRPLSEHVGLAQEILAAQIAGIAAVQDAASPPRKGASVAPATSAPSTPPAS